MAYKRKKNSGNPEARRERRETIRQIITPEIQNQIEKEIITGLYQVMRQERLYVQSGKKGKYIALRDQDLSRTIFWRQAEHASWDSKKQFLYVVHIKTEEDFLPLYKVAGNMYHNIAFDVLKQHSAYTKQNAQALTSAMDKHINVLVSEAQFVHWFPDQEINRALCENEHCKHLRQIQIHQKVLENIPDDITLLFPQAREKTRHFILHVGDTNSGKTYQAIQDLKQAECGVYLAPLRLLALETQERLLDAGVPCSMITGEEEKLIEGAAHMSSTIEMLNTEREYDVCVIDEAQMIADEARGWAWTKAILGVNAPRIHVCMSENALDIVKELIFSCNDTYETVVHKRDTQLIVESEPFDFPVDVRPHDALIVFSRKNVIYVAAELERMGIKVSMIYGSLPYEVRKNELTRFLSGETDVVVSTDAIGMGMNLPVERIVFLESEKFDGKKRRALTGPEVKQIAGRAGRKGLYEQGYVNAMVDRREIRNLLLEPYEPLKTARIQMPERLLDLDMNISEIISSWIRVTDNGLYEKSDAELILEKCHFMEYLNESGDKTPLTKQEMWKFSLIPFDEGKQEIYDLWKQLVRSYYQEEDPFKDYIYFLSGFDDLNDLEADYKRLDLLFSFSRAIGYNKDDFRSNIAILKSEISDQIIRKLLDVSATKRRCKRCGRELSWSYKYNICNRCHGGESGGGHSKPHVTHRDGGSVPVLEEKKRFRGRRHKNASGKGGFGRKG